MEAAFFDLDKTVIARASLMAFSWPLYREGLLRRRSILRGMWSQLLYLQLGADEQRLARIRESVLGVTRGWEQQRVRAVVDATLDEVIGPIVFEEARLLIDSHRDAGRRVYLVSAAPSELVEPMARYFGVDGAIASRAELDAEGCYTGRMAEYAYGPAKAELMIALAQSEGIDLSASYAYSDSATDLPMLEVVGTPVAVNPDRPLREAATVRQWQILEFAPPRRLRDYLRPPPTRTSGSRRSDLPV